MNLREVGPYQVREGSFQALCCSHLVHGALPVLGALARPAAGVAAPHGAGRTRALTRVPGPRGHGARAAGAGLAGVGLLHTALVAAHEAVLAVGIHHALGPATRDRV